MHIASFWSPLRYRECIVSVGGIDKKNGFSQWWHCATTIQLQSGHRENLSFLNEKQRLKKSITLQSFLKNSHWRGQRSCLIDINGKEKKTGR